MTPTFAISALTLLTLGAPAALLGALALPALLNQPLAERVTSALARSAFTAATLAAVAAFAVALASGTWTVIIGLDLGFSAGGYRFAPSLLLDPLSLPFAAFASILCGVVAAFANRYLHRERGYNRFFTLLAIFALGVNVIILANSLELIYAGWEAVGLSSTLLIAFFDERAMPAQNALRTFAIYRLTDLGLVGAIVLTHHSAHTTDLHSLIPTTTFTAPEVIAPNLTEPTTTAVALLLLLSCAGKSALLPFSGWLPRAMEGPTPSSAIFYGALSIHLGAFLLLRAAPILHASPAATFITLALALTTALFATVVGSAQTDIKSALGFATLAQISLIIAEIALHLELLAFFHMLGHASLRTLQILRAPSVISDFHGLRDDTGQALAPAARWTRLLPEAARLRLYHAALHRGGLDDLLNAIVRLAMRPLQALDRLERRLTHEPEPPPPPTRPDGP